ncbi:protein-L-isoaspartate O-methyltransferase [Streptomyces griseocarneus]|nr:protein-L-isoaspartate O-methyltransferase [Streptomyces griseocarneus]
MFDVQRVRLSTAMEERGAWPADSPWVRQAMQAYPRHAFAPAVVWSWDGDAYVPVDRDRDEGRWGAEVYGGPDDASITQVTDGVATSSLSCEAIVADMLDSLILEPGHRALELGAGQGRNAALMAWRTGPDLITSVETDEDLAVGTARRLTALGAPVRVHVGDGDVGFADGAPYERVMSTYAVDDVPWAWVEQTSPGGRIVTPWGLLGHVALTVADDGKSATGWMQGLAAFMASRNTASRRAWDQVRGDDEPDDERPCPAGLSRVHRDANLLFALRVALPDVQIITRTSGDGRMKAWLHDGAASWASIGKVGYQGGPRRLLDEAESAVEWWQGLGEPSLYDFGLRVTGPGEQYVWCRDPEDGPCR